MLVLPMSSPSSSPSRHRESSPYTSRAHREESPQTSELRKKVATTMLSVMPQTSPPTHKRPKLSLQTSLAPSLPPSRRPSHRSEDTISPTTRNTHANEQDAPPPTPSSAIQPRVTFPCINTALTSSSPTTTPTKSHISRLAHDEPYTLPLGTRSILRNSPLPKRHLSATSTRAAKRMFPPPKHVAFSERLVELTPTPILDGSEDDEGMDTSSLTEEQREERRRAIQEEDGHSTTAGQQRRRKRREWIWRPVDDDVLMTHELEEEETLL